MGGKQRSGVGRRAEGLFGARGAVRAARPRCDSRPPVSFSLQRSATFPALSPPLGTRSWRVSYKSVCVSRVVPQQSVSRLTTAASSSTHASLKAKRRSCSANHGSGGEGWLASSDQECPSPTAQDGSCARGGTEQRRRRRRGGCYSCILCINKFYNLCERSKGGRRECRVRGKLPPPHFNCVADLFCIFLLELETEANEIFNRWIFKLSS